MRDRVRFDPDDHQPFEIDDANRPHLVKHLFVAATGDGPADWLLLARVPGGDLVQIPLAPPNSGDWRTCRPVGLYPANPSQTRRYEEEKQ
jgi:hypothetical protein